jgi:hypothetical protein
VIYDSSPATAADMKILAYYNMGQNFSPNGEAFTLTPDYTGIFVIDIGQGPS